MRDKKLFLVILVGLFVSMPGMPLPGTEDMYDHQLWGARAVEQGLTRVYFLTDAEFIDRLELRLNHIHYTAPISYQTELGPLNYIPNYPPLSLDFFWLSTWAAKALQGGRLQESKLLNLTFNVIPLLSSLGIGVVAAALAKKEKLAAPWLPAAVFLLNPALLLLAPILGYADPTFAFFGFCGLILFFQKRFTGGVFFLTLSYLTKPQGLLILPVVLVTVLAERDFRLLWRLSLRAAFFALLPFLPYVITGRALVPIFMTFQGASAGGPLSAQDANIWWVATWLLPALSQKSLAALLGEVPMRGMNEFREVFWLNPQLIAMLLLGTVVTISLIFLWQQLQKGNRFAIFWAAGLDIYAYTMLSLYPHENHLYAFFVYTLPLLFLARRIFLKLYFVLSTVLAMNLYLFEGLGRGMTFFAHAVRNSLGLDLTVILSCLNVAVFLWILRAPRWYFEDTARAAPIAGQSSEWGAKLPFTSAPAGGPS